MSKNRKSRRDLIDTVYKQIKKDVYNDEELVILDCLLDYIRSENLIGYLKEKDREQFKHLIDE